MEYDHAARAGVPAHITLLWPFIPPASITADDHDRLASLFSTYPAFTFVLAEVQRFPEVLFLAPMPSDKIVKLIQDIVAAFPNYPPYNGLFKEIIPHLTIAQSDDPMLLEKVGEDIDPAAKRSLPISKVVTEISLLEQSNGFWTKTKTFPLKSD